MDILNGFEDKFNRLKRSRLYYRMQRKRVIKKRRYVASLLGIEAVDGKLSKSFPVRNNKKGEKHGNYCHGQVF